MRDLARDYVHEDKFQEAENMDRQALAITRRVLGPTHPETGSLLINLSEKQHRRARATTPRRSRWVAKRSKSTDARWGRSMRSTLAAMNNLTLALAQLKVSSVEAEPLARSTLEGYQHAMGPNRSELPSNRWTRWFTVST